MQIKANQCTGFYMIGTSIMKDCFDSKSDPAKWPCGVYSLSIFCVDCKHWVHKRCSTLVADQSYKYGLCLGNINAELQSSHNIAVSGNHLESGAFI